MEAEGRMSSEDGLVIRKKASFDYWLGRLFVINSHREIVGDVYSFSQGIRATKRGRTFEIFCRRSANAKTHIYVVKKVKSR